MNRNYFWGIVFSLFPMTFCSAQTSAPKPFGPVPTENQLRWQKMGYYAFVHFSLNTYTDQSWGYGNEDIKLFNPKNLDCRQWARICK
ncbi:MAG: alpha-L-fucosidase, partial [Mucilaginibacter sp.]